MTKRPIGTKQRTGEVCVESGVWRVDGGSATAPIAIHNRMPRYNTRAMVWVLIRHA